MIIWEGEGRTGVTQGPGHPASTLRPLAVSCCGARPVLGRGAVPDGRVENTEGSSVLLGLGFAAMVR